MKKADKYSNISNIRCRYVPTRGWQREKQRINRSKLLSCQDASAPADAAKIKKMLDGFKIPAAGEEILSLEAATSLESRLGHHGTIFEKEFNLPNHKSNFFLAWGAHPSSHNNHTLTRCSQDFAVKLPRKLIDDLKNTAGGIAATWWMLAAAGRYGKVMEAHHGYPWLLHFFGRSCVVGLAFE